MRGVAAVALLLAAAAAPAFASPVIERVEQRLTKNRRLTVTIEALFEGRGEVRLEGTVNGRKFRKRKRVRRRGAKRLRVRVDARRLRLRKLSEPLVFTLRAIAEERDGTRVERAVERTVPVPVVFVPGLGNELGAGGPLDDVASRAFVAAVDLASGGRYGAGGSDASFVVYHYDSLSESLTTSARGLKKRVRRILRGTAFRRVDVVGYSMGGLVARRWMADGGRGKVRRLVFLGTPNEGAPLAQLIGIALESDLAGSGLDAGGLGDLADVLRVVADKDATVDVLRRLYPTYPWLFVTLDIPFVGGRLPVTPELITTFGSFVPGLDGLSLDLTSPLTPLNAVEPQSATQYFALGYSALPESAGAPGLGTVDEVDVTALLTGDTIDPLALATGEGDGLVPWRSLVMADTAAWASRIEATDLGSGTHATLLADPACIARLARILAD